MKTSLYKLLVPLLLATQIQTQGVDILSSSDTLLAVTNGPTNSRSASPTGEGVAQAIDGNSATKYLNFGGAGSGFIITPQTSATPFFYSLTTANDSPERDPIAMQIDGTNEPISSVNHGFGDSEIWTPLRTLTLLPPLARGTTFSGDFESDSGLPTYSSYRISFPALRDNTAFTFQVAEIQFHQDGDENIPPIFLPGDPIIAYHPHGRGSEYPGSEGPTNLTDGTDAKYLNFAGRGSGFIVTPAGGPSIVDSFAITSANDFPERDPASYIVYGTNQTITSADNSSGIDGEEWFEIARGDLALDSLRNYLNPAVSFANSSAYRSYRVIFPTLKGNSGETMQIAEFQFDGTFVTEQVVSNNSLTGIGSLTDSIAAASAGDLITFSPALNNSTITWDAPFGPILINKSLTIDATSLPNGLTIDANSVSRALLIEGTNNEVNLLGLTITNGRSEDGANTSTNSMAGPAPDGGGISNESKLSLHSCVIRGNQTGKGGDNTAFFAFDSGGDGGDGGGIASTGPLFLSHCLVTENTTGQGGSGERARFGGNGGGIYCTSDLTMEFCEVSHNRTGDGGSLENVSSPRQASNGGAGGGIWASDDLLLNDCLISRNTTGRGSDGVGDGVLGGSGGNGAGIKLVGATAEINRCTIMENRTGDGAVGGPSLFDPAGEGGRSGSGGGMDAQSSEVTIFRCTLAGNSCGVGGRGGEGTLSNGARGGAGGSGGAISSQFGAGQSFSTTIISSTISGNAAGVGGDFTGNGSVAFAITWHGSGGGITGSNQLTLTSTIVAGNSASFSGKNLNTIVQTNNQSFIDGDPMLAPLGNYGGIWPTMHPRQGSPVIDPIGAPTSTTGTDQRGFTALVNGTLDTGAVEVQRARIVTTTNDELPNSNTPTTLSFREAIAAAMPGEVVSFDPSLSEQTFKLTNGEVLVDKTIIIDASNLEKNPTIDAGRQSRVLTTNGSESQVALIAIDLINGRAMDADETNTLDAQSGGGILNEASLVMVDCTIAKNRAGDGEPENVYFSQGGHGGGISNEPGSSLSLFSCTLFDNVAGQGGTGEHGGNGGGIYSSQSRLTLRDCTLTKNQCGRGTPNQVGSNDGNGGGIFALNSNNAPVRMSDCTVSGNIAPFGGQGGGLYAEGDDIHLIGCLFGGNSAFDYPNLYFPGNEFNNGGLHLGENFFNGDPQLSFLDNYGGRTPTMPPLAGSPVIDPAEVELRFIPFIDQRGQTRSTQEITDYGAVEYQGATEELLLAFLIDLDGDGSPVGVELATGNDPLVADRQAAGHLRLSDAGQGTPTLTFGYTNDDYELKLVKTTDFVTFTTLADSETPDIFTGNSPNEITDPQDPAAAKALYFLEAKIAAP